MENLKIGIERDNGSYAGYNINNEILNGLYLTTDNKLVDENISLFAIEIEIKEGATKISKRDNVAIITICIDRENKFQYLVGKDLDTNELQNLEPKVMPADLKQIIMEAYKMTQISTLKDLLK